MQPDGDWPLVSVVFLAYNRREALAVSLEQVLERLEYPADRLEVIVVDNASTDGTAEMLREGFPQVQLIRNPRNVGASAWNVGMTTARGRWRMILDDDCYITGDALKTAVRRAEEERADLVSFRVLSSEQPGYYFNDEHPTGLLSFWGCSAMFSERAIESEPFYDTEIFIWANEMELTMRLLDRGYRHLYLHEVVSVHMKGPNLRFSERSARLNARNHAYIAAKHLTPRDAAVALANLLTHMPLRAVNGDPRWLRALPQALRGFVHGLRRREPVRSEVSRVYRTQVREFLSPLPFLRSPIDRLRSRGDDELAEELRLRRIRRWYAQRPRYYPPSSGVLEL